MEKELVEKAVGSFRAPPEMYNCAQSVVSVAEDASLLDEMKSCGGGRAPEGLCGALWGAMALSPAEETDEITLEGVRIVFTHGHLYDAKWSYTRLSALAASRGAKICLFGHTHAPTEEYHGEGDAAFTLFNPGSISHPNFGRPTYGVITLANGAYLLSHGEADF